MKSQINFMQKNPLRRVERRESMPFFLFANKYLTNPILMTPDIFVQFLHLRVSSSVRTVLMSKPSRFFRNHIFCAVLSGTLLFLGCYLIPMLQLSDSIFHSLHTLKHNIEGITVRSITSTTRVGEGHSYQHQGAYGTIGLHIFN